MRQIANFKEAVRECGLLDMNFIGPKYTWSRRYGTNLIAERLDRALANEAFQEKFAYSYEKHPFSSSSGHLSLLFCISSHVIIETGKKKVVSF